MKRTIFLSSMLLISLEATQETSNAIFQTSGEFRTGYIHVENGTNNATLATGGHLSLKTKPHKNFSAKVSLHTTNALFRQNEEGLFLDSNNDSYSILSEAYLQANYRKNTLRVGRQILNTPYADADDIGMIPNTFEALRFQNSMLPNTKIELLALDKWSGVDTPKPERFTELQGSSDPVLSAGINYEGIENTSINVWYYRLDDVAYKYFASSYKYDWFNLGLQYTNQGKNNQAYGFFSDFSYDTMTLRTAYNSVDGMVSNGFRGGPFYTSSEDHTIADTQDQEAMLLGLDYQLNQVMLSVTHVSFDKGENETDYLLHYAVNDNFALDIIHSNMYKDGKMTRVFANYNF